MVRWASTLVLPDLGAPASVVPLTRLRFEERALRSASRVASLRLPLEVVNPSRSERWASPQEIH